MKTAIILMLAMTGVVGPKDGGVKIGEAAPNFSLIDTKGKTRQLNDFTGKYVVLEWTNHLCPVVAKHYKGGAMQGTQKWATDQGVVWLSIVSSAPGKQGHVTAEEANAVMQDKGHTITAMLLDIDGKVGKTYDARTTPHMYVIDPKGKLIYMGGIDDNPNARGDAILKSKNLVRAALTESMAGQPVSVPTSTPYGCNVKY